MSQNNSVKGFIIGFLAGGTIGAIVALLTTPKSGKELRGEIKQKSGEYLDEADKYFTEKKNQAGKIFNEGKRKFTMIVNDVKSKPGEILTDAERVYNDTKVKTKELLNSGKEKIETEAERIKSSVEAGIETYKKESKNI
jgi:gas vesicle protein